MRRTCLVAALLLVTASCGHSPAKAVTVEAVALAGPDATSVVESLRPMLESAAGWVAWEAFEAGVEARQVAEARTTRPVVARDEAQPQAVSQPCGGWQREVEAEFGLVEAPKACRVLVCESHGDPQARNRSGATGLFQLMKVHAGRFEARGWSWGDATDGVRNIAVAHDLWLEQGWTPWQCA